MKFGNNLEEGKVRLGCDAHAIHHLITTDSLEKNEKAMKLIKSCKAIIHALVWRTEDLDTASERVAQQAVDIVSIDVVAGKKSSSN